MIRWLKRINRIINYFLNINIRNRTNIYKNNIRQIIIIFIIIIENNNRIKLINLIFMMILKIWCRIKVNSIREVLNNINLSLFYLRMNLKFLLVFVIVKTPSLTWSRKHNLLKIWSEIYRNLIQIKLSFNYRKEEKIII